MLISKFSSDDIEGKLEKYEALIEKKMPAQLRRFIIKYNGGETPNTKFKNGEITSDLKALYGLGRVKYSYDSVKPIEIEGVSYLPFACDSFGNELVMDMSSGCVFFMDHESGKMIRIAEDFVAFIRICESKGVNPASIKSVEEREADLIKRGRGNIITDELKSMWRAEIEKYLKIMQEEVII